MNNRERTVAILNYQPYDRMPLVHFGFWTQTLDKWAKEGYISQEEATSWADGNPTDAIISKKLGFDFNYACTLGINSNLRPSFEEIVLEEYPDGTRKVRDSIGAIVLKKDDAISIPKEIDHILKGRKEWEEIFLPRLQFAPERITETNARVNYEMVPFPQALDFLRSGERDYLYGIFCGSLYGVVRNWLGLTNSVYLQADDPLLFEEIIDTLANLCYEDTKYALETGAKFDFAHFWEDIAFRSGPLISPKVFYQKIGPHYKRITNLLHQYGINLVSLDCDGMIDALIPTWIENGVNVMFPMEVGTWDASIAPWRAKYGRELRGVGGMNKTIFAKDFSAIDAEIERLKPLVDLGGFIPCPDHRIAPDAKWDNVRYYCDRMHQIYG